MNFNKREAQKYLENKSRELTEIKRKGPSYDELNRWWQNITHFCVFHGIRNQSEFIDIDFKCSMCWNGVSDHSPDVCKNKGIEDAEYLLKNIIESLNVYKEKTDAQSSIAFNINNKNELNNLINIKECGTEVKTALESLKNELNKPQPDKFAISKLFDILVDKGLDVLVNIFTNLILNG